MSLRWLLGAVTILASLVFGVSVVSVNRLIRMSSEQRLERGRDLVQRELARWAEAPDADGGAARFTVLGLRGGTAQDPAVPGGPIPIRSGLSGEADRALSTLAAVAPRDRAEVGALDVEEGTLFLGARRSADGRLLWVAYTVSMSKLVGTWRLIAGLLTSATVLLGGIALGTVIAATRGARGLKRSLAALEEDLTAEVPRPALAELSSVAEGVASLAASLAAAERERERLAEELGRKERLAALGRVVAGVAHEVRNPLASIKLRVDMARTSEGVPAEVAQELDAVDEEITRLDRLLTDFLVVSGRRIGRRVDTELRDVVDRRLVLLSTWAKERGVSLAVSGRARAVVDPDACARAVDNLVKNGVEASPAGAEVRVQIERRGGLSVLTVEDDGDGVPEDRASELFEPFFTTKPEGTGLGLAVSRAIAVASGGRLTYQREGGVTRFELSVPAEGGAA
ncbi:sensor histidine kinase [Polyangium sorediatum]|uniref:histidine kinase n=1 Tax=Polyangium sorediatum TaxID=889274 RepID=A0ABT6NSP5_9BACT|nr:ATP-binding protein [Polyangium sorediatum]MDI1431359.1 ATP-binding protein [Polyangium sorediatum]